MRQLQLQTLEREMKLFGIELSDTESDDGGEGRRTTNDGNGDHGDGGNDDGHDDDDGSGDAQALPAATVHQRQLRQRRRGRQAS